MMQQVMVVNYVHMIMSKKTKSKSAENLSIQSCFFIWMAFMCIVL